MFNQKITDSILNKVGLNQGERAIREGFANLYYNPLLSDGGSLLLTNQRLIFLAHSINLNPGKCIEIDLRDIAEVSMARNMVISQLISVKNPMGEEVYFVVYKGKEWIRDIENAISQNMFFRK